MLYGTAGRPGPDGLLRVGSRKEFGVEEETGI